MIDTLKLALDDYQIMPGAELTVRRGDVDVATGEVLNSRKLWHDGVRDVEGAKAFHNGDDVNVSVKSIETELGPRSLCLVQFSVPKVATGSNYEPVDYKGTKSALRAVQKYLRGIGIHTSIKTATMSRLDACQTLITDETYQAYHPVLSMLQGQRLFKRDYGTTFLWANTQQELCFYDKIAEMMRKKHKTDGLPTNSLRAEWRLLKSKKVQDSLGLRSVSDLLDGYEIVQQKYRQTMEKQLFHRAVSDVAVLTASEIETELAYYKNVVGKRYWFRAWMMANGMRAAVSDVEALKVAVANVAEGKNTARRLEKQIEDARLDAVALDVIRPSKRPLGELYSELKTKVLS